jgi:ligand-binding sensor domain-containing protein
MVFSANGVYHYDSSAAHVENFTAPHPITCAIGNNACSNYWAGTVSDGCFATQDGVNYITLDTTIANRKLVDNRVNTCFNDRNCQAVLVGTKGGFSRCPAGLPCQNFTTANGLIENDITAIMEDCTGRIWLGTRDSGMMIFDAGTFTRLTTANGLPDNHIMSVGLITNDCTVWVGSKDGNITVVDSAKQVVNILTAIRKYDNETAVRVFPQPATNHVQFTFDRQVSAEFRMVDIKGQSVFVQQLNNASFINADVSGFATGMYFYSVTDPYKGVTKTGKVSVIH